MKTVAIVGRPNVGKSTLFNRLIGTQQSIVEPMPGVTRDRLYGKSFWNGRQFSVIDTGGFIPGTEDVMERAIREQAMIAIEEADSIIYLCDGSDGVTPFDTDIATILRKSDKHVVLVINKCDNSLSDNNSFEFHKLGLGTPYPISALSGRSTGDFLDEVVAHFEASGEEEEDPRLKIAIVGRPNVGKSSITNALLGKERSIVTDIPGTTRDSVDSIMKFYGEEIVLIDTAGLRRRSKISENIEMYSILRTSKAIERCDVAIIVLDATLGLEDQDKKIINQVEEERKGMLIAVNKWDLVEKDTKTSGEFTKKVYEELASYYYVPIQYISAKTKQRLTKVVEIAKEIKVRRATRIKTNLLTETLLSELERTPPPAIKGKDLRINYVTQVNIEPPVFAFFCNHPELMPDNYKRYLERVLRQRFDFEGTPISFVFRRKNVPYEEREI
ncbi:MAG: putative GTPase [Ignavibacteria bacterium]|nr:putative GTPase [Ignavibacteria bacterium]